MTSIKTHLVSISEKSKNPKTKKVVGGLLDVINNGEVDETKISGLVNESLKSLGAEDPLVKEFFSYLNTKTVLENLGIRSIINAAKGSKLYESDDNLKGLVDHYQQHINEHPEYALADTFLTGIKRYNWNKFMKGPIAMMESNIAKYRTYKLVAEAIYALQNIKDADLYEDAVKKLDYAFHLPENQIRSYIKETFADDYANSHSIIRELVESLYKIPQEKTGNTTWNMSKDGRTSAMERVSPVLVEEGREVIMMNGRLYEIKDKKISRITNVKEAKLPEKFIKLCEAFTNFVVVDKKLKITDGVYEFAVLENDKGKPVYELDGVPQVSTNDDVMGDLSTMGVEAGLINLLSIVGENICDIVILDNVLSVIPDQGRAIIDIIKIDGKYSINIFDASNGIDELVQGDANIDAITQVKTDFGVDMAPFVTEDDATGAEGGQDDEAKTAADAELLKKIEDLQSQLEEVTDNMQKIEDLDEDYQKQEDIQSMYDELKRTKSNIEEDIKNLENEKNGKPVMEDMSETIDNIFNEIGTLKTDAETIEQVKTDDAPDAHAQKNGGMYNINDDISVTPIIELEKSGDGVQLSSIYLQVLSKTKEGTAFQDELTKALEGSKFTVADDGHVNLNISPIANDAELNADIKTDIASVLNSVATSKADDQTATASATAGADTATV